MNDTYSAAWQQVTCRDCKRTYQCTPQDDYYAREGETVTGPDDGLCFTCLVAPHGYGPDGKRVPAAAAGPGTTGGERCQECGHDLTSGEHADWCRTALQPGAAGAR